MRAAEIIANKQKTAMLYMFVISGCKPLTHLHFEAFNRHFCPKRLTVILTYTDGAGCHARSAHQEKFGV